MMVTKRVALALAVMLPLVLLTACGGGSLGGVAPAGVIEGGLPPGFPNDFPLYPGLKIVRSQPFGQRYIIEGSSEDSPAAVAVFYAEALMGGRWEILEGGQSSQPGASVFRFTAPGFVQEGRVVVTGVSVAGVRTSVAIVMPFEALVSD